MKIKNIIACGALLFGAVALTSCSDDETYDFDGTTDNLIYLAPTQSNVYDCQVMRTPVGIFGRIQADIPVNIQHPLNSVATVTAEVDPSLVEEFNTKHGTSHESFPSTVISALNIEPANIPAGEMKDTLTVSVSDDQFSNFTAESYVLPLNIIAGSSSIKPSVNYSKAYIVVTTSDVTNFVSLDNNKVDCNIIKTPVGVFGGVDATFNVSISCAISSDWISTLTVDNSLISAYNEQNNTSYNQLPDDALSALTITPATIKSGETQTTTGVKVTMDENVAQTLNDSYLIPLRLTSTYDNGETYQEDDDIAYITIGVKETLINDDATEILGTIQSDHSTWTCIAATNLNPDEFQNAFQNSWYGGWTFTQKNISSASFTVDLGDVHKLSAFMFDSYVMSSAHVYLSTDNSNWVDVGDTSGHNAVRDGNWNYWYVLYSGVNARYVKVDLNLNANSWAWSWNDNIKFNFAFDD